MNPFVLLIVWVFLVGKLTLIHAQGPDLLVQQYRQGEDLEYYRKLNFDFTLLPHFSNTTDRETKGAISIDFGVNVHYRFTKTFGLSSGVLLHRIRYKYLYPNDNSNDHLQFLQFPLILSVYPYKRIRLFLGGAYQWILTAQGQPPPLTQATAYPKNTFINSLGIQGGAQYRVWKKFSVSILYQMQKQRSKALTRETQNFQGFALGISYTLLNPNRP